MRYELPQTIQPLLQAYADELYRLLPGKIVGIYLYGSIALGGYEEEKSDIDFVTVLKRPLTAEESAAVDTLHRDLYEKMPIARKLDGVYVTEADVGKQNDDLEPYPYCAEGIFHSAGYWDVNHVTWWLLAQAGMTIAGKACAELPHRVAWADVKETMAYNLHEYWQAKSDTVQLFHSDEWVEFAVLTLCRIYDTLRHQRIISKAMAAKEALLTLPVHLHPLILHALSLRQSNERDVPPEINSVKRAQATSAFIRELIAACEPYLA